ncbi:MAG: hypothetical protein ABH816_02200 [Candidatus Levyibacteriota bacterium]
MKVKLLLIGYLIVIVGLFFYSFTQVDLGLTLTRWSPWQVAQKFFQSIGYFNRPLSAVLYIAIVFLLFLFYLLFLWLSVKKKIAKKEIWTVIIITSVILGFSYNAFSYDLFNYIFDAKIVTFYHQNPYLHKALDYQGDAMLSFMHWTHRVYPYGPVWLGLTAPLSFLGLQFFLPTFFLFKFLSVASFLGTAFYISKILKKISAENELHGIVFFALNPLVIIESLVSGHNDTAMMFLSIMALYLIMNMKYFRSILVLGLSIGVKFATIFLVPIFILLFLSKKIKKEISWRQVSFLLIVLMIIPVFIASLRTNFQPWYLLYVLPFASLLSKKYFILIPSIIISFFSLLMYVPFLYSGNWNPPVPTILFWIVLSSIIVSLFITSIYSLAANRVK